MASIQEKLQRKREPLDKWSIREQLSLSFAVARVGDQNWMSVSRSLKPFCDGRPADWFHQKNCAAQYGALLDHIETPKRKKRTSSVAEALDSPANLILKKLVQERIAELKTLMESERAEYRRLQDETALLKSGNVSEEQLDLMCKQIDEEEKQKEKEALEHVQWLKEREVRKAELERVWRPVVKVTPSTGGQKRKASESMESLMQANESAENDGLKPPSESPTRPALSPLLTSLLKSPSHAQNVSTSSILHSAITSPRSISTNPTIASLLNSSTAVQVSPGIQQLVTSAISQEPPIKDTIQELLNVSDTLPNLKVEDIENTIGDDSLPEIKNEEVDVIISNLIENNDIVTDPETHLLDGDDIISNLESELEQLDNKEKAEKEQQSSIQTSTSKAVIDPFEFQEDDPDEYEPKLSRPSSIANPPSSSSETVVTEKSPIANEDSQEKENKVSDALLTVSDSKSTSKDEGPKGYVEIVEVVVMEDEEISKKLNKSQIQDIVHSSAPPTSTTKSPIKVMASTEETTSTTPSDTKIKEELIETNENDEEEIGNNVAETEVKLDSVASETTSSSDTPEIKIEPAEEEIAEPDDDNSSRRDTFTPEYTEDFEASIQITKLDKFNRIKRDYSRTKKKDETDFDILLAVEQAVSENLEDEADSSSEKNEKQEIKEERSESPWTEEEEPEIENNRPTTRRYSTPATPIDSVPSSPASSSNFEDDRDYRSWKKSILLLYSRLANHKYASWFLKPITDDQAPEYHKFVKKPMDLSTIKKNVENGQIRTTAEFKRDVLLMFNNAIMYNKTCDTVYRMTLDIQQEGVEQIKLFLQAQTDSASSAPLRRETRTSEAPTSFKRKRGTDSESSTNSKSKKRKDES